MAWIFETANPGRASYVFGERVGLALGIRDPLEDSALARYPDARIPEDVDKFVSAMRKAAG